MELLGLVGAVGVHLTDHVVPGLEGDPEAMAVRRAEAALLRPMDHLDSRVAGGQLVGQLPGAVRGVVVDDEHVQIGLRLAEATDDPAQVVGLVVRRHHHDAASEWRTERCCVGGAHARVLSGSTSAATTASVSSEPSAASASRWGRIRRFRRYRPHASSQPRTTRPPHARPDHAPIRTAGVTVSYSATVELTYDWVWVGTEVTTEPSGAMTPVMPLM